MEVWLEEYIGTLDFSSASLLVGHDKGNILVLPLSQP